MKSERDLCRNGDQTTTENRSYYQQLCKPEIFDSCYTSGMGVSGKTSANSNTGRSSLVARATQRLARSFVCCVGEITLILLHVRLFFILKWMTLGVLMSGTSPLPLYLLLHTIFAHTPLTVLFYYNN